MDILLINPRDEMIDRIVSSGLFNSMVRYVLDDSMSNFLIARMYLLFSRIAMKEYFLKILDVTSVDLKLFSKDG